MLVYKPIELVVTVLLLPFLYFYFVPITYGSLLTILWTISAHTKFLEEVKMHCLQDKKNYIETFIMKVDIVFYETFSPNNNYNYNKLY